MKKVLLGLTFFLSLACFLNAEEACTGPVSLQRLKDGNARFVAQNMQHPHQTLDRVKEIAPHQAPFATILCCSDSRVPPEILFDQGLGDLFIIRNAGNVADKITMASIQYAVEVLKTPLVVVLGHSNCGAAKAAMKGFNERYIAHLVEELHPAVVASKTMSGNQLENIIEANIALGCERIEKAKFRSECPHLLVKGAFYDLETGKIEFYDPEF